MTLETACPKPAKREKQARKPVRRRNAKRYSANWKRAYGSPERVEWVNALPCAACGVSGYSQNAHVLGNDGARRKGHYTTIAPLCTVHPITATGAVLYLGCHSAFDEKQAQFRNVFPQFNAVEVAAETERAWVQRSDAGGER